MKKFNILHLSGFIFDIFISILVFMLILHPYNIFDILHYNENEQLKRSFVGALIGFFISFFGLYMLTIISINSKKHTKNK